MNQQDRAFMISFSMILGILAVLAVAIYIIAGNIAYDPVAVEARKAVLEADAAARLAPVGQIVLKGSEEDQAQQQQLASAAGEAAAAAESMPGDEAYAAGCNVCHDAGVLDAPKKGDQAVWSERYGKGLDVLVDNAVNGFNQMPAKGGNVTLSDDSVRAAVVYLLQESGVEVEGVETQSATPEAAQEAPATAADQTEPEAESEPTATEQTQTAEQTDGSDTQQEQASNEGKDDAEPSAAVAAAGGSSDSAASAIALPDSVDLTTGEEVYRLACVVCHEAGVAGSPKLGDKEAWAARLEQGWDVLVEHSVKGFKGMPPKGGRMDLPDDQIISALGYMVSNAQ